MTGRAHRLGFEYAAALAAAAFGWSAACSWRGMVAAPSQYLEPALVAAVMIALIGATARSLRLRWYATLGIQLVALLVWLHHRQADGGPLGGWLPTPEGLADVIHQVRDGADAINTYAAPVPTTYFDAPVYLIACAVLILVLIDLIACGLRLPAWAGLPVLVAVTVPISVLDEGLPSSVYITTGLLFALLLAVLETDRAVAWGPVVGDKPASGRGSARLPAVALGTPAALISGVAVVLALVASFGVPLGGGLINPGSGSGSGSGGSGRVTLSNPLVDLRRDLVRTSQLPLLDVRTDSSDLSYVRLTVLDRFTDGAWQPSARNLGADQRAEGPLPNPPGLSPLNAGPGSEWLLRTNENFSTTWLPTPSVTRSIQITRGDWRYDPTFLDIASADDPPPTGVEYRLTANSPDVDADELAQALPPPNALVNAMTAVPKLPSEVEQIAKDVTASGTTAQAKASLLQNWFRRSGGFAYSLDPAPGGGLEQLTRFVTVDKVGYCEQFAAAMALMARSLGIPARVVVGFLGPSETVPGGYRYTTDDLHAWPEIYFTGAGWVRFEPTPAARTGAAPEWSRNAVDRPNPSASPTTPSASPTQRVTRGPTSEPSGSVDQADGSSSSVPAVLVGVVGSALLVLLLALPGLVRSGQRRRRLRLGDGGAVEVEALWQELRATAVDHGAPWPEGRSPRMVAETLGPWVSTSHDTAISEEDRAALRLLVSVVEQNRYRERFELSPGERADAAAAARRWVSLIRGSVDVRRVWGARLAPRSVLTRQGRTAAGSAELADDLEPTARR